MQTIWFASLIVAICFEGLGRRYLPQVPSVVFYFIKDPVLIYGLIRFKPAPDVSRIARNLYRGFTVVWVAGLLWTLIEIFNPAQQSFLLGIIGFRAYWLWWLAPPAIAMVLQNPKHKRRAIYALLVVSVIVVGLAVIQFASPPDSAVNLYSVVDGEAVYADVAPLAATGRARVSSTFSFLSGFQDFTILVPTLLLSIGLDANEPRLRVLALAVTLATAAVVPMSGSRASIILGALILIITAWTSGLLFTRAGRRILLGSVAAAILALVAFPDAFIGIQSRFADVGETTERLQNAASVIPAVALVEAEYPPAGIGTGMEQNAKMSMHILTEWDTELEPYRQLVELGPAGFLLVWTAKFGLIIALFRAYSVLKRAGRRGGAAAAVSYAALTLNGNLTFDHIWQALYFVGCGVILAEVVSVTRAAANAAQQSAAHPEDSRQSIGGQVVVQSG